MVATIEPITNVESRESSFKIPLKQTFREQVATDHALLGFRGAKCKDATSFQRAMKDLITKYVEIESGNRNTAEKLNEFFSLCTGEVNVIEIWSEAVILGKRWPNSVAQILAPMLVSISKDKLPRIKGSDIIAKTQRRDMMSMVRMSAAAFKKYIYYNLKPSMQPNLQLEVRDMLINDKNCKVLRRLKSSKLIEFRFWDKEIAVEVHDALNAAELKSDGRDNWWG